MVIFIEGSYLPVLPGGGQTHPWFPGLPIRGPLEKCQKLILIIALRWWCGRLAVSKALESFALLGMVNALIILAKKKWD